MNSDNLLKKTDSTPLETAREWEMEIEVEELEHLANVSRKAVFLIEKDP